MTTNHSVSHFSPIRLEAKVVTLPTSVPRPILDATPSPAIPTLVQNAKALPAATLAP